MTVNEQVSSVLKAHKATQRDLAAAIGVSTSTLNNWLKLGRDIPAQYIIPICEFFDISPSFLLTGQDTEKAPATELSVNERDMLKYFKQLTEREQAILIGEARAIVMFDEIASVPPGSASSDGKAG